MEPNELAIHEFYDGDFTFHVAEYEHEPPRTFRVRIDCASPEARAIENSTNTNETPGNWKGIRPATADEIRNWIWQMTDLLPLRNPRHTMALRALALQEPFKITADCDPLVATGLWELAARMVPVLRDFVPTKEFLVESREDMYTLTETGRWLVSLMK
jgi:hypothetical protein